MERQVFNLALDQDLFRRLGPYGDVFLDHAVADEEVGKDGPTETWAASLGSRGERYQRHNTTVKPGSCQFSTTAGQSRSR